MKAMIHSISCNDDIYDDLSDSAEISYHSEDVVSIMESLYLITETAAGAYPAAVLVISV